MSDKSDILKENLLKALEKTMGIVTSACKKAKVSRKTFYEYYKNDPAFKEQVDDVKEIALDFAESKLMQSISNGSDTATLFYLKCKGKSRGYVEKSETENRNYNYNSADMEPEEVKKYSDILEKSV
jgi:hypothetical protein